MPPSSEHIWNNDTVTTANSLKNAITQWEFILGAMVANKVLQYPKPLTVSLQLHARDIARAFVESSNVIRVLVIYDQLEMPSNGITIAVMAETNASGRPYMEDFIAANLCPSDALKVIPKLYEQVFISVFNRHGGKEAMKFAREHDMIHLTFLPN